MAKTKETVKKDPPKGKTSKPAEKAVSKPVKTRVKKPVGSKQKKPPNKKKDTIAGEQPSKEQFCSFCKRSSKALVAMIAGPDNIFICCNCLDLCNLIMLEEFGNFWRHRLYEILGNR